MYKNSVTKKIVEDYEFVINQLLKNKLYRDSNKIIVTVEGSKKEVVTWSNKEFKNIMYDIFLDAKGMLDDILNNRQFIIELYDKSIFQFECIVNDNKIEKLRMVFLKKDNIIWEIEKINLYESEEDEQDDWYETNYGIPVMIRMDYAPDEHIDIIHSKSHLTLSNSQNCRIPMKTYFMFSEFVNFILINFYNMHIDKSPVCYNDCVEISNNELKTYHINWE